MIAWLPRLSWLQASGTMKQMLGHQAEWLHRAGRHHSAKMIDWRCDVWVSKKQNWLPTVHRRCKCQEEKAKHPTFAECQHPLLAGWDHPCNAALESLSDDSALQSEKRIFWLYQVSKCTRAAEPKDQPGCPYCAGKVACRGNSLQMLYPEIAAEWDQSKNKDQRSDDTAGYRHMASWSNPQRRSWQQSSHSRTCSFCSCHIKAFSTEKQVC